MQPANRNLLDDDEMGFVNRPVVVPDGVRLEKDIAYGTDPKQRLDVYIPKGAENAPVLFMVHGGGWRRGDKGAFGVVQNKVNHYLAKGWVFISANYRFVPDVDPMAQAADIAAALAFAQGHATDWGGDAARFVLMGHSAGAHLVTMLAAVREIGASAGAQAWLGAVALDSAAYDVVETMEQPHFPLYDVAFGEDRTLWEAASPARRLTAAPPPMLLVCSSRRADAVTQTNDFVGKVNALGGWAEVLAVDMRHGVINLEVGTPGDYTARIDAFMRTLGLA